jgi:hypothetical protein
MKLGFLDSIVSVTVLFYSRLLPPLNRAVISLIR